MTRPTYRAHLVVEIDPRRQPATGGHAQAVGGVWAARVLATSATAALRETIAGRIGPAAEGALHLSRGPDESWCATFGGDPRVWIALPTHLTTREIDR